MLKFWQVTKKTCDKCGSFIYLQIKIFLQIWVVNFVFSCFMYCLTLYVEIVRPVCLVLHSIMYVDMIYFYSFIFISSRKVKKICESKLTNRS